MTSLRFTELVIQGTNLNRGWRTLYDTPCACTQIKFSTQPGINFQLFCSVYSRPSNIFFNLIVFFVLLKESWRCEVEHAVSKSRRLHKIPDIYVWAEKKHFVSLNLETRAGTNPQAVRSQALCVTTTPGARPSPRNITSSSFAQRVGDTGQAADQHNPTSTNADTTFKQQCQTQMAAVPVHPATDFLDDSLPPLFFLVSTSGLAARPSAIHSTNNLTILGSGMRPSSWCHDNGLCPLTVERG